MHINFPEFVLQIQQVITPWEGWALQLVWAQGLKVQRQPAARKAVKKEARKAKASI
jgi:hypothetical protein